MSSIKFQGHTGWKICLFSTREWIHHVHYSNRHIASNQIIMVPEMKTNKKRRIGFSTAQRCRIKGTWNSLAEYAFLKENPGSRRWSETHPQLKTLFSFSVMLLTANTTPKLTTYPSMNKMNINKIAGIRWWSAITHSFDQIELILSNICFKPEIHIYISIIAFAVGRMRSVPKFQRFDNWERPLG